VKRLFAVLTLLSSASALAAQNNEDAGYAWLAGGADVIGAEHGHHGGYAQFMFGAGGGFVGVSQMFMSSKPHNDCDPFFSPCSGPDDTSIGETALLFGGLFMHRLMYAAIGPSRADVTGFDCQSQEGHRTCIGAGLAGEVGWLLPNGPFGLQLRIFGDANDVESFVGTSIGIHFGGPHVPGAPYGDPDREQRRAEKALRRAERLQQRAEELRRETPGVPSRVPAAGDLARLRAGAPLYDRPARAKTTQRAPSEQPIVLKRFEENPDGRWWFVGMGSTAAWVLEADIVFDSH
jgi:hypothetical protein